LPNLGNHEAPGRAVHQPDVEPALQCRHVPREAGLGNAQGAGRLGIAPMFDHLGEVIELIQRLPWHRIEPINRTICSVSTGFSSSVPEIRLLPTRKTTYRENQMKLLHIDSSILG